MSNTMTMLRLDEYTSSRRINTPISSGLVQRYSLRLSDELSVLHPLDLQKSLFLVFDKMSASLRCCLWIV